MASLNTRALRSAALAVLLSSTAVHADVSAEQVWSDWQTYMAASGYAVTATEARSGDALELSEITMVTEIPEEDVTITLTLAEMTLLDNGNGTVSIAFPPTLPLGVLVEAAGEDPVNVSASYTTQAWAGIVSGEPDNIVYTYSAAGIGLSIDEITADQVTLPMSTIGTVEMNIANFAGSSTSKSGALYETAQKITTGAVNYLVDVTDPDGAEGRLILQGSADSMDTNVVAALPEDGDMNDMSGMLKKGFAVDATLAFTGGAMDVNFNDTGESFQLKSTSGSSDFSVAMNADGVNYGLSSTAQDISLAGTDIPFPVELSAQENGFTIQMPVSARDTLQPFAMDVTLADFVMSDLLWGLVDPTGQLPRDPATVAVALSGTAKLLVDILDPMAMAEAGSGGAQPGELHSVDVEDLTVRAAGAELLGKGAFTFDNGDLTTFDGLPAPTGKLDLSLAGGNGLLDKLVAMGLIPDQEASGVRMMMGLFAVPGSEPDTLTSTIEVQGNGQIFANGQRIQ
ncbi:MAG: DUF2125 domain-containing protein [Pseudomonadota bacterium]